MLNIQQLKVQVLLSGVGGDQTRAKRRVNTGLDLYLIWEEGFQNAWNSKTFDGI